MARQLIEPNNRTKKSLSQTKQLNQSKSINKPSRKRRRKHSNSSDEYIEENKKYSTADPESTGPQLRRQKINEISTNVISTNRI